MFVVDVRCSLKNLGCTFLIIFNITCSYHAFIASGWKEDLWFNSQPTSTVRLPGTRSVCLSIFPVNRIIFSLTSNFTRISQPTSTARLPGTRSVF